MPTLATGTGTATANAAPAGPTPTILAPAARLRGEPRLPGDKSISHRALMLGLLAEGRSTIAGASDGADVASTAGIVAALGAAVAMAPDADGRPRFEVASPGPDRLHEPGSTLDCGNSGTSLRLFAGILAGLPLHAVLDGDASLRRRPVARIIEPLRSMGATLDGRRGDALPPVTIAGRRPLRSIDWRTTVPSAQVKSAILLAALAAEGTTRVHESIPTRDHTERMLRVRGVAVRTVDGGTRSGDGGRTIEVEGGQPVAARHTVVPADPSAAAFWLVAGACHPDAELTLRGVGVNLTRRAGIDLLRRMGAAIEERPWQSAEDAAGLDGLPAADAGAADPSDEPIADLAVRSSALHGIEVGPEEAAAAIDELPVLCLAATQAEGRTTIRGAGELRVKESDRLAGIVDGLTALGARVVVEDDALSIVGPTRLHGGTLDARSDHRLAMTFAIAALLSTTDTRIDGATSAAISDPRFFRELERIRS